MQIVIVIVYALFLSTLSLRRATAEVGGSNQTIINFYPRSPCGERRHKAKNKMNGVNISIHALLAESDRLWTIIFVPGKFLSTLSLRRATWRSGKMFKGRIFLSTLSLRRATKPGGTIKVYCCISIHALLAESDATLQNFVIGLDTFLSTLSLRRATLAIVKPNR